jgi:hypothetical protein
MPTVGTIVRFVHPTPQQNTKTGLTQMPEMLRRSIVLIATYALLCVSWTGFAQWIASTIIAEVYEGRADPKLDLLEPQF